MKAATPFNSVQKEAAAGSIAVGFSCLLTIIITRSTFFGDTYYYMRDVLHVSTGESSRSA